MRSHVFLQQLRTFPVSHHSIQGHTVFAALIHQTLLSWKGKPKTPRSLSKAEFRHSSSDASKVLHSSRTTHPFHLKFTFPTSAPSFSSVFEFHQAVMEPGKAYEVPEETNRIVKSLSTTKDPTVVELLSKEKCFSGYQHIYRHHSNETKCDMKFSVYIPTQSRPDEKFHVLFFLSGVMCNEQNFIFKTGFHRYASEQRIIFVGSDTSPRNVDIPGDRDSWVFGRSAGWYLDALMEPWDKNYRMYSYFTKELVETVRKNFPTTGKFGLCGHSMGGNGAIVIALRNPNLFQALSVLAPSCNPTSWGDKIIYTPFLGDENKDVWKQYDAFYVAQGYEGPFRKILVDCGTEDEYLHLLVPQKLVEATNSNPFLEVNLNMREGYNHSYYFMASYIEDHIKFHADALTESSTEVVASTSL